MIKKTQKNKLGLIDIFTVLYTVNATHYLSVSVELTVTIWHSASIKGHALCDLESLQLGVHQRLQVCTPFSTLIVGSLSAEAIKENNYFVKCNFMCVSGSSEQIKEYICLMGCKGGLRLARAASAYVKL